MVAVTVAGGRGEGGLWGGGETEKLVQNFSFRGIRPEDLTYNMVIIVGNTVLDH